MLPIVVTRLKSFLQDFQDRHDLHVNPEIHVNPVKLIFGRGPVAATRSDMDYR